MKRARLTRAHASNARGDGAGVGTARVDVDLASELMAAPVKWVAYEI